MAAKRCRYEPRAAAAGEGPAAARRDSDRGTERLALGRARRRVSETGMRMAPSYAASLHLLGVAAGLSSPVLEPEQRLAPATGTGDSKRVVLCSGVTGLVPTEHRILPYCKVSSIAMVWSLSGSGGSWQHPTSLPPV